jgi:thymidylate synthase (FAD)
MGQLVKPVVHFVGCTEINEVGLLGYLQTTGQGGFWADYRAARDEDGLSSGEALCSVMSKLCYKSLVVGKNSNIKKTRELRANIESCHNTGHGSVVEHCVLNFIVTNCSRILTHEIVRHRAGTAFSQTSGRYCRLDSIDLVWDSVLDPVKDRWLAHLAATENLVYLTECALGLRKPPPAYPNAPAEVIHGSPHRMYEVIRAQDGTHDSFEPLEVTKSRLRWVPDDSFNFDKRKALTSAIRRIAPNGQANEIGVSFNIRTLRHCVQVRTARSAEREIRDVFAQIYHLVSAKFPTMFHGAKVKMINGLPEISGMKMQPYEIQAGDPKALEHWTTTDLTQELEKRKSPEFQEQQNEKTT